MKANKKLYKFVINRKQLLIDILPEMVINKSPFNIKIQYKNSIGVNINGYDISDKLHDKYNFYSLPTDNEIFSTVDMSIDNSLMTIDNRLFYVNEFIYLPPEPNFNISEKTSELYFHSSVENTELYVKVKKLGISISDDYRVAKYFVINQEIFENLNMKELSDILSNHCLIISLIDENKLRNNSLKSKYTANETLTKVFLFNIVKNSSYVDFIFNKIINAGEYKQRAEFMNVDLTNINNGHNIYDYILKYVRSKNINEISLSAEGTNILSIIKSKILNKFPKEGYKNIEILIKFIIKNNFSTKIAVVDMNYDDIKYKGCNQIIDILKTVNWLGDIEMNVSKNSETKYNIYIFRNKESIEDRMFEGSTIVYLLDNDDLLLI